MEADAATMEIVEGKSGDAKLRVSFSMEPVQDLEKSKEAGRPIFVEQEFIRILIPGDRDNIIHRPFWNDTMNPNSDVSRFGSRYRAWKSGAAEAETGTPLKSWPPVTKSQVEELSYFNVKTVEQLAEMSDSHLQKFMDGHRLRQRAKDYLAAAAGQAPVSKMRAELEQRDAEIENLKRMMKEQAERIDGLVNSRPKEDKQLADRAKK